MQMNTIKYEMSYIEEHFALRWDSSSWSSNYHQQNKAGTCRFNKPTDLGNILKIGKGKIWELRNIFGLNVEGCNKTDRICCSKNVPTTQHHLPRLRSYVAGGFPWLRGPWLHRHRHRWGIQTVPRLCEQTRWMKTEEGRNFQIQIHILSWSTSASHKVLRCWFCQ